MFVCHCGSNIGGLVDCKKLAEEIKEFPDVAHSEDNLYTCSENGLNSIKNAIEEYNLNRVVVASCTPRTHEPLFREAIQEAGLNKYLFNFVNIRDQCTWVHTNNPKAAYKKVLDLIKMGVSKAKRLEPLKDISIDVNNAALVVGAGVSGISAALSLSKQGFETYLVEKKNQVGGMLNSLYKMFPENKEASELLQNFKKKIKKANNLNVLTSSEIEDVNGYVGNYNVTINQKDKMRELDVGTIVIATGASVFQPLNLYGYDGTVRITQLELEEMLKTKNFDKNNIVMIQCVGARNEDRNYCSNICCMTALKNALLIKEMNPEANISILFRDLYTPGITYEKYYRKAREAGILFIKYSPESKPIVKQDSLEVVNKYIGKEMKLPYDLLVLSTPLISNEDNQALAQLLKVPLEKNEFFLEAHVKLRPIDFATDGVFLCGSAKWPTDIAQAITQGYAAASRAATILSHKTLEIEGSTAYIPEWNKDLCKGCEVCIEICPYGAIRKNEEGDIEIIQALCKGCGLCGASCTKKAIEIKHFTNEQILSEIYALGGREIT